MRQNQMEDFENRIENNQTICQTIDFVYGINRKIYTGYKFFLCVQSGYVAIV